MILVAIEESLRVVDVMPFLEKCFGGILRHAIHATENSRRLCNVPFQGSCSHFDSQADATGMDIPQWSCVDEFP